MVRRRPKCWTWVSVGFGALACSPGPQGVVMNRFIPDDKIAHVKVCRTTGRELLQSFGEPSGRGRDGDFETLNWGAAAVVSDSSQGAVATQTIIAWIDGDGMVAGLTVNAPGLPEKPPPCRDQDPGEIPDETPAPPAKPKEA